MTADRIEHDPVRCPLLQADIALGRCWDIAAQAHALFKTDDPVFDRKSLSREKIAAFCAACPNFPLER